MATQRDFEAGYTRALIYEGGYSNHPNDTGGPTNLGIIQRNYSAYLKGKGLPDKSVKFITHAEAKEIYKKRYWDPAGCNDWPPRLAIAVFDWNVNSGRGVSTLQRIVGSNPDNKYGPKTLNDVFYYINRHGETRLLQAYFNERNRLYKEWGTGSQRVFLQGWLNRSANLETYLKNYK